MSGSGMAMGGSGFNSGMGSGNASGQDDLQKIARGMQCKVKSQSGNKTVYECCPDGCCPDANGNKPCGQSGMGAASGGGMGMSTGMGNMSGMGAPAMAAPAMASPAMGAMSSPVMPNM